MLSVLALLFFAFAFALLISTEDRLYLIAEHDVRIVVVFTFQNTGKHSIDFGYS